MLRSKFREHPCSLRLIRRWLHHLIPFEFGRYCVTNCVRYIENISFG
jgi:hypothetical protein